MTDCKITIEIENGRETYRPGDALDVRVRVQASEPLDCRRLTVQLGFETSGKGDSNRHWLSSQTLFAGAFEAGESEYRCALHVPELGRQTPPTYNGELIQVSWYVRVLADLGVLREQEARIVIDVAPPMDRPRRTEGARPHPEPVQLGGLSRTTLVVAGGLAAAAALLLTQGVGPLGLAIPLVPAALITGKVLRDMAAARRVGKVTFGTWPLDPFPGEDITLNLVIEPPLTVDLELVRVVLQAKEKATTSAGDGHTATRTVREIGEVLLEQSSLNGGIPWSSNTTLTVPLDGPVTFSTGDNRTGWEARLEVRPRGAPRIAATRPFVVNPG